MNRNPIFSLAALLASIFLALPVTMLADDSAASIAAGGLVARRETRVVMAKEVLRISPAKVIVDYDFRNDTDEDVTTEVAFPIPPYTEGPDESPASMTSFSDFQVRVGGKAIPVQAEAKAFVNGREVTEILVADKIDIASFGHHDWNSNRIPDFTRLPSAERKRLAKLGIFDPTLPMGVWTVHLQYHWTQTFPAHSTVQIRHEYTPYEGFEFMQHDAIRNALHEPLLDKKSEENSGWSEDVKLLASFCPDAPFLRGVEHSIQTAPPHAGDYAYPHWVDFILTSANTWKQPIEDFTLIVERGRPVDGYGKPIENEQNLISFCSPQNVPVEKLDADRFQVHLTNFVPKSELRIGFFDIVTTGRKTGSSPSKK
ncbi:MAG TPA: DUF4424 family protein [Terracidiphilus sp.]|nr:DUF4424 family protein [Terracidiphilus sp.]